MLQMIQNKVEAEGKANQGFFDKFMCYCANAETLIYSVNYSSDEACVIFC